MTGVSTFAVTLHHLAADLKQAGAGFPDVEQADVPPEKLRKWLEALVRLAPTAEYPVTPELRIAGPRGRFVVQVKNGQVRLTSWSTNEGGSGLTPERILAVIMGTDAQEAASFALDLAASLPDPKRGLKIGLLVAGILISNAVTAWMVMRPAPSIPVELLPEYTAVTAEAGRRILADFAGDYETGGTEGDRALSINGDGTLNWIRYGPNRTVAEETTLKAKPADASGRPVLVAENHGMIEMRDAITIVYFNEPYRRKGR